MRFSLNLTIAALLVGAFAVLLIDGLSTDRKIVASLAQLGYVFVLLRYRKTRTGCSEGASGAAADYLVAYATETGTARQLARQTCKRIRENGLQASLVELNELNSASVPEKGLLVVASTSGNGDAPRTGNAWLDDGKSMDRFAGCSYAVLALGDRSYPQFCGFGLAVAAELRQRGANPLFDPVTVNEGDPASVRYWFRQLAFE